ncbi:hypothetical protein JXA05_00965 [Candidatus Peregrinibacteria bacterium]|nr:hypothetical protein [Candidatus Peregrinibacteria bacterium]
MEKPQPAEQPPASQENGDKLANVIRLDAALIPTGNPSVETTETEQFEIELTTEEPAKFQQITDRQIIRIEAHGPFVLVFRKDEQMPMAYQPSLKEKPIDCHYQTQANKNDRNS